MIRDDDACPTFQGGDGPPWKAIYERDIRPQVEADHDGAYVAVDVDSGSWAISNDVLTAARRLRAQHPEAIDVWLLRVGYRALHHFGGRPWRRAE